MKDTGQGLQRLQAAPRVDITTTINHSNHICPSMCIPVFVYHMHIYAYIYIGFTSYADYFA